MLVIAVTLVLAYFGMFAFTAYKLNQITSTVQEWANQEETQEVE